jgi:hypothetical protein
MNFLQSSDQTSSSIESATSSQSDVVVWQQRIQRIQSERATPEVLARIRENAERKQRTMRSVKTAKRLEKANYLSSASNMMHLQTFSAAPAPSGYMERSEEIQSRAQTIQHCSKVSRGRGAAYNDGDDDECDNQLDELSSTLMGEVMAAHEQAQITPQSLMAIRDFDRMDETQRQATATTMESEMTMLLSQLAVEPQEEAEMMAKFALFETFLATIVKIREETMTFWSDNCDLFEGASRAAAQQDINKIDSTEAMGIQDDPRKWFVYLMTKKANENCAMIGRTLATLRARLEMISATEDGDLGECPFCLDSMTDLGADRTCVLGCCHRVCVTCWDHWTEVRGPRGVFCPLCRHEEFVAEVLSTPV